MRKLFLLVLIATCSLFTACNNFSPEKNFDTAVLGCNMLYGFASDGFQHELESPSVRMINGDKDKFAPMKRKEVLNDKIEIITDHFNRLKQLKETSDNREILAASRALHEYVLPVYENEYRELARLYDDGASDEVIHGYARSIHDKYYLSYTQLYDKLIAAGKVYAAKHHINVTWDVQMSPQ